MYPYVIMFESALGMPPSKKDKNYSRSKLEEFAEAFEEESIMTFNTFLQWVTESSYREKILPCPSEINIGKLRVKTSKELASEIQKLKYVAFVMPESYTVE